MELEAVQGGVFCGGLPAITGPKSKCLATIPVF